VIGSGLTPENAPGLLGACHGAIVASYFRRDGNVYNPIEPARVGRFMGVVRDMRAT
jgi:predicted TIM-barrel enzyme